MSRYRLFIIALFCISTLAPPVASAADSSAGSSSEGSAGTPSGAPSSRKLLGSIKAVDIEAAECLRQMGDALKKMERAGLELMGEATRQDYISVGDPDVVGTMIIPALPDNMMAVGPYLPLRPKWVDYYLDQIGKLIPIYAELTDSLVMPDSTKAQATQLLDQMRPLFEDARARYLALVEMSKDLKHADNKKVAVLAVMLHDDMQKMEKIRVEVFKLLKRSEKRN
jgi:hypothetical protein